MISIIFQFINLTSNTLLAIYSSCRMNNPMKDKVFKKVNGLWKELGKENDIISFKKSDYDVQKLQTKSLIELEDLLRRQNKILMNKNFVAKLPDKGEKLKQRLTEIKIAINNLSTNIPYGSSESSSSIPIESFEWANGGSQSHSENSKITTSNNFSVSDEEDTTNPLELLASHSLDVPRKKHKIKSNECEDPVLVIEEELKSLNIKDKLEEENNLLSDPAFNKVLLNKIDGVEKHQTKPKFKTHKPLKPSIEKPKDFKSPLWIESTALGALEQKLSTKMMPLQESLRLSKQANQLRMGMWQSESQNGLSKNMKIGMPKNNYMHYRDANTEQHILDDSEEEITSEYNDEEIFYDAE